jgi:hypothetical protein
MMNVGLHLAHVESEFDDIVGLVVYHLALAFRGAHEWL